MPSLHRENQMSTIAMCWVTLKNYSSGSWQMYSIQNSRASTVFVFNLVLHCGFRFVTFSNRLAADFESNPSRIARTFRSNLLAVCSNHRKSRDLNWIAIWILPITGRHLSIDAVHVRCLYAARCTCRTKFGVSCRVWAEVANVSNFWTGHPSGSPSAVVTLTVDRSLKRNCGPLCGVANATV